MHKNIVRKTLREQTTEKHRRSWEENMKIIIKGVRAFAMG